MSEAIYLANIDFVRQRRYILKNVNWAIRKGENWALLGPNGCGKSTTLAIVNGYEQPTSGLVRVLGETYGRTVLADVQKRIGFFQPVRQENLLQKRLTALEIVMTGYAHTLGLYRKPEPHWPQAATRLLEEAGLGQVAQKRFTILSSGERRRVLFLRVLAGQPEIIILDEPFESLDFPSRERFMTFVDRYSQSEASVILVTHRPEEISTLIPNVMLMKEGGIFNKGPKEQMLTGVHLSELYDYPVKVDATGGRYFLRTSGPENQAR